MRSYFTERYLNEGVPDRCASRSLNWGIDIPIKGYEDKKIYGWFENVWGYVTASKKYCERNNLDWEDFWKSDRDNKIYLIHAKDNIPFHTVIFPALLLEQKKIISCLTKLFLMNILRLKEKSSLKVKEIIFLFAIC